MGVHFDDFELDRERFELRRDGAVVAIEPQVFDVLSFLIEHRDRVVSKEELLDAVWGDRFVSESALTSRIKTVRQALGDDGTAQRLVQTVRGRGYRFVADINSVDGTQSHAADEDHVPTNGNGVAEPLPSGTVTFLFTDVEQSTRYWQVDPEEMRVTLQRHDYLVRSAIEHHGGHVFTTSGGSFAAAFHAVGDAVDASRQAQISLAAEDWPASCPIRVRMGLHIGDAHERGREYFGPAVNKAARVMAAGNGGQILVSSAVAAVCDDAELIDLGEHRLKDLSAAERLFQLGSGSFPVLRTLESVRHNLPVERTALVGRDQEIGQVTELIGAHRLVTLLGIGGTGKTRLATAVAADQADQFVDGAWFVDLVPASTGDQVVEAIASAAGLEITGGVRVDSLANLIGDRQMLVVLDNCEHITDEVADVVDVLLERTRAVRWLATSREPLQLPDERHVHVSPLAVYDDLKGPATQVFIAAAERVGVEIHPEQAALVVEVCRQLDGLPLSIELAASQLRHLSIEQLAARLDQRFEILARGRGGRLRRQASLQAVLQDTWDMLDASEQELLLQIAAFPAKFTVPDVETVCAGLDVGVPTLTFAGLVDRSLIAGDGQGRHRVLETVRLFAHQRWAETAAPDSYIERHTRLVLDYLDSFEPQDWYTSFGIVATAKSHYEDHRAVEDRLARAGNTTDLTALLGRMTFAYSFETGTHASGVIERIKGYMADLDLADHERGILNAVASSAGLASRRQDWIAEGSAAALPLLRSSGSPEELSNALILGSWMTVFRDFDAAVAMTVEAEKMAESAGALALADLARVYQSSHHAVRGRIEDAHQILDSVAPHLESYPYCYSHLYAGLTRMALTIVSDPELSRTIGQQLFDETSKFGLASEIGWGLSTIRSVSSAACGDIPGTQALLGDARAHIVTASIDDGLPDLLLPPAALAWKLGNLDASKRWLNAVRHATSPTQTFMSTIMYQRLREAVAPPNENPLEDCDIAEIAAECEDWVASL